MITLNLKNKPAWLELAPGVRVKVKPLTTALMLAGRSDPAMRAMMEGSESPDDAQIGMSMASALARLAIIDWEGVGDQDGNPVAVSPEGIDALLDVWPIFDAFQEKYVSTGLLLEQEKNASPPSPSGSSAGAGNTARPARKSAKPARKN